MVSLVLTPLAIADSARQRAHAADRLGRAACLILNASKFPGIPHVADLTQTANACTGGKCFEQLQDPNTGSLICHYGRAGYLAVGCHPNKRAARTFVDNLVRRHHFRRIRLNVDASAVGVPPSFGVGVPSGSSSNTTEVAMALRVETVAFVMNAFSDDNPNPTWPGVKQSAIQGARNLIATWRHLPHICPRS